MQNQECQRLVEVVAQRVGNERFDQRYCGPAYAPVREAIGRLEEVAPRAHRRTRNRRKDRT